MLPSWIEYTKYLWELYTDFSKESVNYGFYKNVIHAPLESVLIPDVRNRGKNLLERISVLYNLKFLENLLIFTKICWRSTCICRERVV